MSTVKDLTCLIFKCNELPCWTNRSRAYKIVILMRIKLIGQMS